MQVTYDSHMGDDLKVVNMARVSFSKRSDWVDQNAENHDCFYRLCDADKSLIQFLARGCTSGDWDSIVDDLWGIKEWGVRQDINDAITDARKMPSHWAPFAHCQITLHIKVPMFVQRQLDKHQVGFVSSEVSRRYVTSEPEFYVPDEWRKAADNVKQGSSDEAVGADVLIGSSEYNQLSVDFYHELLDADICPEQARMILPQSTYTESFKTGSLYGWANLYNQRSDPHAQKETRQVAEMVRAVVEPLFPESWRALTA